MNRSSRRHFLAVTGAGAAAAGAASVLPSPLATAQQRSETMIDAETGGVPLADAVLMACVTDVAAGEVTVIHGAEEVTVTDPALAERIAWATRTGA